MKKLLILLAFLPTLTLAQDRIPSTQPGLLELQIVEEITKCVEAQQKTIDLNLVFVEQIDKAFNAVAECKNTVLRNTSRQCFVEKKISQDDCRRVFGEKRFVTEMDKKWRLLFL